MQGRSEVANIIRKSADSLTQSATVRVEHFTEDGRFLPGFRYELARKTGERTLELGLGRFIGYDDSTGSGRRVRRDPLGVVLRDEGVTNESDGYTHQVNAAYKTPLLGGVLRVNGLANINDFKSESHFNGTAGELDVVDVSDDANQEFGGTFTRDFGPKWSAELLGLYKAGQSEFRSASEGYGADSGLFLAEEDTGERIVRLTLKHRWSDRLSFEAGGETAFNFLDGAIAFQENGVAKTLPSSNVRVEEDRSELFALANWRPRTDLTVEGGMRFERSTIRQIGDNAREREFQYPKPRFLATWTPNPRTTLRFRAERELGQLDFGDFVSSTDLTTDVVAAGNPELEPDKTWVYEVTGERRFWDTGALSVTLRHEEITDVIDRIPIDVLDPATGLVTSTLEAPGNIGDGTNDELELNVTLPLTRFGLTGAELKLEAEWRNSEVIDPTTGESRRISRQRPTNRGHLPPGLPRAEARAHRRLLRRLEGDQLQLQPGLTLRLVGVRGGRRGVQAAPQHFRIAGALQRDRVRVQAVPRGLLRAPQRLAPAVHRKPRERVAAAAHPAGPADLGLRPGPWV
jgi:hypothetical protein